VEDGEVLEIRGPALRMLSVGTAAAWQNRRVCLQEFPDRFDQQVGRPASAIGGGCGQERAVLRIADLEARHLAAVVSPDSNRDHHRLRAIYRACQIFCVGP